MTEAEWLTTRSDLSWMLSLIRGDWVPPPRPPGFFAQLRYSVLNPWPDRPKFRASDRQLRLFAVACCRRIEHLLNGQCVLHGIHAAEFFADDPIWTAERVTTREALDDAYHTRCEPVDPRRRQAVHSALEAVWYLVRWEPCPNEYGGVPPENMVASLATQAMGKVQRWKERWELQVQCELLRDITGNPFRPVTVDPTWLTWNDASIPKIAQSIYDSHRFEDLPILADALEEAGCTNAQILTHLRGPGPHTRGCWPLDLILDRK